VGNERRYTVLIVDDDRSTREGLGRALRLKYDVVLAESGERALEILGVQSVDVMLSDIRMPGMDGLTLVQRAQAHYPQLVSVLLTAYGNVQVAVEAMKRGAYDFLTKPVNLDHMELLLERAIQSRDMAHENAQLREELDSRFGMENLIGQSVAMHRLFETVRQAAPSQATVLIQGESGTGKELVAHAIHRLSTRASGPFVAVHCAALASGLLESELFGHEKGAFTGAAGMREGRFEKADGGTLFLDEIGEIDASVQVKLLRVLEEQTFERVGGDKSIKVDIRLIAATNRDLRKMVDDGEFREDLYFRLDVVGILLPPLRQRADDVALLANHFVQQFAEKNGRDVEGISPEASQILMAYDWPGNVRELRNTVEKMVVLSRGPRLTVRDVPSEIRLAAVGEGRSRTSEPAGAVAVTGSSLADSERAMILKVLREVGGNKSRAASQLGISRRTLYRKLEQYGDGGES
jgi:two-component system response regulator AtoC